jgi:alanine dehydrogenase
MYAGTLLLTRSEIGGLMEFSDYVTAVENAFRTQPKSGVLDVQGVGGMFHIKAAALVWSDNSVYVAVKINGNFPENKRLFGLPTIQGAILLADGIRGYPVAILDSIEITSWRTAAATAIAARHSARKNSKTALICGAGNQGRVHAIALKAQLPLARIQIYDLDSAVAQNLAMELTEKIGISVLPAQNIADSAKQSDIIVTCTTSREFILRKEYVKPGTFVAAVGADSHDKQEIDPSLLKAGKVIADVLDQSARIGDLHHAIRLGLMQKEDVFDLVDSRSYLRQYGWKNKQNFPGRSPCGTAQDQPMANFHSYGNYRCCSRSCFKSCSLVCNTLFVSPTSLFRLGPAADCDRQLLSDDMEKRQYSVYRSGRFIRWSHPEVISLDNSSIIRVYGSAPFSTDYARFQNKDFGYAIYFPDRNCSSSTFEITPP